MSKKTAMDRCKLQAISGTPMTTVIYVYFTFTIYHNATYRYIMKIIQTYSKLTLLRSNNLINNTFSYLTI